MNCELCGTPIRKIDGDESKPDDKACYTHVGGSYQCPGSRSEFDLATPDRRELRMSLRLELDGSGI